MISRSQVAAYVAGKLPDERAAAVKSAAAWLVTTGRKRQAGYLARDVAQVLAGRGYVFGQVTTARPLTAAARGEIEEFIKRETGARQLELVTAVEPAVIGGARIETPGAQLDSTVQAKLATFVEGVGR